MNTLEFDATYSAVTGERVSTPYVPTVTEDNVFDILIDGQPRSSAVGGHGWHAITGHTGQYGYRGAIFHPSETASDDQLREWVRDAGGDVFAIVVVEDWTDAGADDATGDSIDPVTVGWAVIYRSAEA